MERDGYQDFTSRTRKLLMGVYFLPWEDVMKRHEKTVASLSRKHKKKNKQLSNKRIRREKPKC